MLLKPVPFPDPDRLVMFMNTSPQGSGRNASPAKFQHWREQTRVVQDVAAFRNNIVNFTGGGVPEQLRAGEVSADYFRLLGAPVFRGRTFSAEEDRPGGERVVVLSHEFVDDGASHPIPSVIGTTMSLSGDPHTVIGIIGPAFDVGEFGPPPDVWIAFQLDPNTKDQGHYFSAAGRLKPGVTLEQAKAQLDRSAGGVPAEVSSNARRQRKLQRDAVPGSVRQRCAPDAAGARRRRRLRPADRVCERREPAAGARDGPEARDRRSRGDRRRPRPHHPAAADRERAAVARRWSRWASSSDFSASGRC